MTETTQKFTIESSRAKIALQELRILAANVDWALERAGKKADKFGKSLKEAARAKLQPMLDNPIKSIGKGLAYVTAGAAAATAAIYKMAQAGERAAAIGASFEKMGGSTEKLKELRRATGNMVTDTDLKQVYNMAKFFKLNTDSIGELAKVARGASMALGTDMQTALSDLMTAISRRSKPILDNLGITLGDLNVVYQDYAKSIGLADYRKLTDDQKTAAFQAAALKAANNQLALSQQEVAGATARAATAIENTWDKLNQNTAAKFDRMYAHFEKLTGMSDTMSDAMAGSMEQMKKSIEAAEKAIRAEANQTLMLRIDAMEELAVKTEGHTGSVKHNVKALEDLTIKILEQEKARKELQEQIEYAKEHNNVGLQEMYEKRLADTNAVIEKLTKDMVPYRDELRRIGEQVDKNRRKSEEWSAAIAKTITDATRAEVERQEGLDEFLRLIDEEEAAEEQRRERRKDAHKERMEQMRKEAEEMAKLAGALAAQGGGGVESAALGMAGAFGKTRIQLAGMRRDMLGVGSIGDSIATPSMVAEQAASQARIEAFEERKKKQEEAIKLAAEERKAEEAKNKAIRSSAVSGAVAVGKSVLQQIASKEQMAAIEGAIQVGYAIAAGVSGDIAGAIGHAAAATQFFIAAGTSGGGGASSSGGGGRSSAPSARREIDRLDNERGGGGTTLIIENKGLYIDDEQAMRIGRGIQRYQQLGGRMG